MSDALSTWFAAVLTGSALLTALVVPFWKSVCLRVGLVDSPGHRKIHDRPVPLAGGLAILSGGLASLACGWLCQRLGWFQIGGDDPLALGFGAHSRQWLALLCSAVAMTLLGALDDKVDLRPGEKFTGQLTIAVLVTAAGVRFPAVLPGGALNFALTVLWILTVTNAVNFTDNMNGLCAGLATIGAAAFGSWSATHGQTAAGTVAFSLAGASAGFLLFNFPRASVFLGDSGSHLLGFVLAVLTILPPSDSPHRSMTVSLLLPILVLAVPLVDLIAVVLYRLSHGKPIYIGDNNHFSHRLVRAGLTPAQAVALLWFIAAATAGLVFLF